MPGDWKLVQHSQYGVINRDGPKFIEPANPQPCELSEDAADPHALVYSFPVMANMYDILRDDGYDTSLPPDVDLYPSVVGEDDHMSTPVSGFAADSSLLAYAAEIRSLKDVRKIPI